MTTTKSCCGPECCQDEPEGMASRRSNDAPDDGEASHAGGEAVRATVREKYGESARRAAAGERASCGCGPSCCTDAAAEARDPITADLYDEGETAGLPAEALLASLGCGNPTALALLVHGERVLDLGSGGGIDVLLSARRVGPTGKAWGLDMTDEMLALARENQRRCGLTNVEFLRGEIENIPLPSESVDVVISNCVINLSADKARVLREAARVLVPGGRFAVSDVVLSDDLPPAVRASVDLFTGCVAGALTEGEYRRLLEVAGFVGVGVEPTRVYSDDDMREVLRSAGLSEDLLGVVSGKVMSAFVRATRASASVAAVA